MTGAFASARRSSSAPTMAAPGIVDVLDADPWLRDEVLGAGADRDGRRALARVRRLAAGRWVPPRDRDWARGHLGLLVLDGLLIREVRLGGRASAELFGSGDLLRPWDDDGELAALRTDSSWTVLAPTRLAVLDDRFAARAAGWPALTCALAARAGERARWLSVHLLICQVTGVDLRLLMVLWLLAERWGRVSLEGTVLPLNLSHGVLARLIGARRPTVTVMLGELRRRGVVSRGPGGSWLLRRRPDELRGLIERGECGSCPRADAGEPAPLTTPSWSAS